MNEQLPNNTDLLFKEMEDVDTNSWLKNPANKFFLYSEGYREAGKKLHEHCSANLFYSNALVYPLIFCYRQFIELRIKELLIMSYKYLDDSEKDFPDKHNLMELWSIYRTKLLPRIESSVEKDVLDNVEKLLVEFNKEDPNSMSFRYPVTKAPNRKPSLNRTTIDLNNFKLIIDKLIYFFDWQWDMISSYQDLKQEMLSDMYRDNWR